MFAIEGGINKAPREQLQAQPPTNQPGGPEQRYRALREYRDAYPDLAIPRRTDDFPAVTAAVEKTIPAAARAKMRPAAVLSGDPARSWAMAARGEGYVVYSMKGEPVRLNLTGENRDFQVRWLDGEKGEVQDGGTVLRGGVAALSPPVVDSKRPWVAWLTAR